jgi:hypothetical protein
VGQVNALPQAFAVLAAKHIVGPASAGRGSGSVASCRRAGQTLAPSGKDQDNANA